MSAIWPKSQLQRLCELARAERAKKDKTLKRPGKDAGIEEKCSYLEKLNYSNILSEEILIQVIERLEKLSNSGTEARNKYAQDLELLKRGMNALKNGGIEVNPAELEELKNEAVTNLNALKVGYPQASGKELLVLMENDKNQEKYFYIIGPSELLEEVKKPRGNSRIFSKEYVDNIRELYSKEKNNYENAFESIGKAIQEKTGKPFVLKGERDLELFLNEFEYYKEIEHGKQKLNKENCDEFLREMENRILKLICEAKSGGSLKQSMILAFCYPECLERFCSIRNLAQLNEQIEYNKELTEQLISQMMQQAPGLTQQEIARIAAGLNIKLANSAEEKQEAVDTPKREVSSSNLTLVHSYIIKEMPAYIQKVTAYYNEFCRIVQNYKSEDYIINLDRLRKISDNFWLEYQKWTKHRKLLEDINFSNSNEAMMQIAEGDRQMQKMAETVKKDGAQLERILAEFLSPRMECIKEYDQRYRQLAAQSEELIDIFINPLKYNLSRRDKKKKERDLNECAGNLKQLDDEILKEKYRLEEDGKASGELMKKLLQVRALVRETKEQAERRLNKNRSTRTRWKAAIIVPLTLLLSFAAFVYKTSYDTNKKYMPTEEEVAKYNELMNEPTLEKMAPLFPDYMDVTRISDLHGDSLTKDDFKRSGVELTPLEKEEEVPSKWDTWRLFGNDFVNRKIYGKAITFNYEVNGIKYQITTILDLVQWVWDYERKLEKGEDVYKKTLFTASRDKVLEYGTFDGRVLEGTFRKRKYRSFFDIPSFNDYPMTFVFGTTNDGVNYENCYVLWNNGETIPCTDVKVEKVENAERDIIKNTYYRNRIRWAPSTEILGDQVQLQFSMVDPLGRDTKKFVFEFSSWGGELKYHVDGRDSTEEVCDLQFVQ